MGEGLGEGPAVQGWKLALGTSEAVLQWDSLLPTPGIVPGTAEVLSKDLLDGRGKECHTLLQALFHLTLPTTLGQSFPIL